MSSSDALTRILKRPIAWLSPEIADPGVVLSTRVRLARNLEGHDFPGRLDDDERLEILERVRGAIDVLDEFEHGLGLSIRDLDPLDRHLLLERKLITTGICRDRCGNGVFVSDDGHRVIMVNGEDHVHIQVLQPGLALSAAWQQADNADTALAAELGFAYRADLGFLTARPGNAGTGMRASVLLHLPGLRLADQLQSTCAAITELGFAARAVQPEGTDAIGNLLTISNRSTLGDHEESLLESLNQQVMHVANLEKQARQLLLETQPETLFDYVGRAYGTGRQAFRIDQQEALEVLSAMRLGIDLGMISRLDVNLINELTIATRPAHLHKKSGTRPNRAEGDLLRAALLREKLGKGE